MAILLGSFMLILSFSALSQSAHLEEKKEHIHGTHEECELPKSSNDIIECALIMHPEVKKSLLNSETASTYLEQASQVPNPSLSTRYLEKGDSSELEANLSFIVELGSKRDSRKKHANALRKKADKETLEVKGRVKKNTILKLYRLRQVLEEGATLVQKLNAFKKVIKQLESLPRLTAEQETAQVLFQIAYEEAKIEQSIIFEEQKELEHYFHITTGHSLDEMKKYLPAVKKSWPSISSQVKESSSAKVLKLQSMGEVMKQQFEIQKSNAWPDLKIGPSINIEKDENIENKMVGINIELPLPLFQQNDGAKRVAQSRVREMKQIIKLTQKEESHERFEQVQVYKAVTETLKKTIKRSTVYQKHKKIEDFYLRGVVTSSVFLDSLKQKFSYLRIRNEREIKALDALWSIYNFDGRLLQEKI